MSLDDRDRAILAALAQDAWLTYGELGARVNLSASAVQRRVERLRAEGVITGAKANIAPEALGRPLRIFVLVELREESSAALASLAKRLAKESCVVETHYLAGPYDILIALQMRDMSNYADFAEKHLNANSNVRRYKTLTSLRTFTSPA